ncbi:hypothetical protein [Rhizobium tubonense]|uniref:Transmembrane protein n=1 Tax=Rhizobium tubonense TaxID=484088 RepID=A0A2W4DBP5_9HYPH|nr:hypothetical protein [Rhizobium tubonense]PZM14384.1 hypothetical protein CPY51_11440 [Rhizobium tubonense]
MLRAGHITFVTFIRNAATILALFMLVAAPMLAASPADAYDRRGAAACGPRGCAAAGCGPRGCAAGAVGRGGYRRGGAACGSRGCVAGGSRGYARPRGVVVVNPRRYWRPGGAIAAGAAIGFIAGAAAVSVAGQPPSSGQCWYYTSPAKTSGFWDVCPR